MTIFPYAKRALPLNQRSPNFLDAGPNSRSYQRPRAGLFVYRKQKDTTRITSVTFAFFYLFSLLVNMFAMWFMKLLLLLHNRRRLIVGSRLNAAIRRVSCKYAPEILLQLPDNAYASHSKCPLQFTNFAALMHANIESTEVRRQGQAHIQYRVAMPRWTKNVKSIVKICLIASAEAGRQLSVLNYPDE